MSDLRALLAELRDRISTLGDGVSVYPAPLETLDKLEAAIGPLLDIARAAVVVDLRRLAPAPAPRAEGAPEPYDDEPVCHVCGAPVAMPHRLGCDGRDWVDDPDPGREAPRKVRRTSWDPRTEPFPPPTPDPPQAPGGAVERGHCGRCDRCGVQLLPLDTSHQCDWPYRLSCAGCDAPYAPAPEQGPKPVAKCGTCKGRGDESFDAAGYPVGKCTACKGTGEQGPKETR